MLMSRNSEACSKVMTSTIVDTSGPVTAWIGYSLTSEPDGEKRCSHATPSSIPVLGRKCSSDVLMPLL